MILKTKILAFTISEMIVVLILTSIIVGLAFSVLSLVSRHMMDIKNNYHQSAEVYNFESKLWLDMNRYPKATFNSNENLLILSSELDTSFYQFSKENIISSSDTFEIQVEKILVFFAGKNKNQGIIDAIKIETTKALGFRDIFVYKYNDATAFMN